MFDNKLDWDIFKNWCF